MGFGLKGDWFWDCSVVWGLAQSVEQASFRYLLSFPNLTALIDRRSMNQSSEGYEPGV